MRLKFPRSAALYSITFAVLAGPAAQATPYYWDVNGTATGFSTVVGAWNTGAFWGPNASGTGGTYIVNPTTSDDLNIVAATTNTGTITVTGTKAAGSLTFGSTVGAVTITGGTINLAVAGVITVNNTAANTISSLLTGAGTSLTKAGSGTLILTGANTGLTSTLNIDAGTLRASTVATTIGTMAVNLGSTGTSTATLEAGNSLTLTNAITVRGTGGTKTIRSAASGASPVFSGNITANDNLSVVMDQASPTLTISGTGNSIATGKTVAFSSSTGGALVDSAVWSGAGATSYSSTGTGGITITGAKTYSGGATIGSFSSTGTATVTTSSTGPANAPTSGGFGTGPLTLSGGRLRATINGDTTVGNTITFSGNMTFPTVATEKSLIFTGDASLGANRTLTVDVGSSDATKFVDFQGAVSGASFTITKAGTGTLRLSGVNSYTGPTTINSGVLSIGTKDSLPGYNANGLYTVASGATLAVQNGVTDSELAEILGTTNFVSGANFGFDTTSGNRTFSGNIADTVIGPLGLVKMGANTLTLSGTNTYTGPTAVLAGGLQITSTSALPNWNVNGGFLISSAASLIIPNTISETEVATLLGTTNVATGATIAFDTSLGDRNYVSAVTNSTQGLLNIEKIGNNSLTLAGTNTYTGNTIVSSGTLNVTGTITGNNTSSTLAYGNSAASTVVNVSNDMNLFATTGANAAGSVSIYNQTAGTVTTTTPTQFGSYVANNGGYGYFNLVGGTYQNTQGSFVVTNNTSTASTGVAYVAGNLDLSASNGNMVVAYSASSNASLTVAPGGTMNYSGAANSFFLTVSAGSYGVLNVAGGNMDFGTRAMRVGNAGAGQTGILNLDSGTFTLGQNFTTAATTSNFYVNHAGGTFKAAANLSAPFAPGAGLTTTSTIFGAIDNLGTSQDFAGGLTMNTNGFNVNYSDPIRGATGNGVKQANITITGGSGYIGAPAVTFTGGTLAPNGTPASGYAVISGGAVTGIVITSPGTYTADPTVTLTGGGGTGASVSLAPLTANASDPGLAKVGTGTLTLSAANTYTGATSVNVGTLNLSGSLTSNVSVANNANLSGEGSTTGSVTFSGTSDLIFDPSTAANALTANTVNATGAAVTITPTVPVTGTGIVVLNAPGGITGTVGGVGNNFIYTGRGNLYTNGGNTQLLIDTAPVSLAWRGNDGTNPTFWDLNTTTNWDSAAPQKFFTGDAITFDDTAASYTVDINAANVLPGNIVFNNSTAYTVQGAFGIFGGATLTKNGTGSVVLNSPNNYTGATSVNAGALNIRHANALGSIIAGTTVTSGAALEIQGGISTAAEAITLNGTGISSGGALRNISGINTLGAAVALASDSSIGADAGTLIIPSLTGAFVLSKVGAGTVNIAGATAVTSTIVDAGTLYMGAQTGASITTTLGAANAVTLNNSSNLTIRRTDTGADDLYGAIGGTGSLTLLGDNAPTNLSTGDFTINNASTYSGGTTIIGARAAPTVATAFGTGPVTVGANAGIFVNAASLTFTNNFTLGGQGWNEGSGLLGALRMNTTTLSGNITLTANTRLTGTNSSTISGKISGGFGLDFFEDTVIGTITLTGDNDYTGPTVVNSMGAAPATLPSLIVGHNNALGTSAGGTTLVGTGTTGNGTQLTLATGITVTDETLTLDATASGYRASLLTANNGTGTWDGNVVTAGTGGLIGFNTAGTTSTLTVGSSDTDTITGSNFLTIRGTGTGTINSSINIGAGGIFKTDAGTWTITSNNNDFTGAAQIAFGTVVVGSIADAGTNSALGAGTTISLGQNSASPTGTLRFTGASGGSSNRSITIVNGATGGAGVIENTVPGQTLVLSGNVSTATPASASTLTLTGAGDGLLSGGISGSPLMTLAKSGAGTWSLSGTDTHTAATTVTAGTLTLSATSVVNPSTTVGTVTINGATAVMNIAGTYNVPIGNGNAYFEIKGGGTLNFSGTSTLTNATAGAGVRIGEGSAGTMNVTGGSLTFTTLATSNLVIGRSTGGNGTLNVSGGVFTIAGAGGSQISNTAGNSGTVTVSGTGELAMNFTSAFSMGLTATSTSTFNLNGGTFTLGAPMTAAGTSTFNFDGGTFKANAASISIPATLTTANVKDGGAIFDSNGNTITFNEPLLNFPGATTDKLTKNGAGTLILTGDSTYTGGTIVNAGTLRVNNTTGSGTGTAAVAVNGTSTLGGSGSISGSVTVAATASLSPGAAVATAGVLTVSGGLDISALAGGTGTLAYDLDTLAGTNDKIVTGSIAIGTGLLGLNDFVFTNVGGLQAGTYKLISSGTPVTGTLDASNLTGSIGTFSTALQITGNDIELVVTSDPYITWSGGAAFGIDSNGDGVSNGLAWLLGAADKDVNATALLPKVTNNNGDLVMTFNMLNSANRGGATLKLQHSNDLGGADPWTAVTVPDVSGGPVSGVTFTVTAGSPLNTVVATISSSEAAAGKSFGRLLGENP